MKNNTMKNKFNRLCKQVGELLAIATLIMLQSCHRNPISKRSPENTSSSSESSQAPKTEEEQGDEDFEENMKILREAVDKLKTLVPPTKAEKEMLIKKGEEALDKMLPARRQEIESTLHFIGSSTEKLIELFATIRVDPSEILANLSKVSNSPETEVGILITISYFMDASSSIQAAQVKNQPRNNY